MPRLHSLRPPRHRPHRRQHCQLDQRRNYLRRAALHASDNALRVNRDWRGKQSRNHGYSNFIRIVFLLAVFCTQLCS